MNKLLVLVDWQFDFVNGILGFKDAELMDPGIAKLVQGYIDDDLYIVATHDTHKHGEYENTVEGQILPMHTEFGTPGWNLFGEAGRLVDSYKNVYNVHKGTFPSLDLVEILRQVDKKFRDKTGNGLELIEFAGVDASICVLSNVVMAIAALPNVKIRVYKDLIGSGDSEAKNAAIKVMNSMLVEVV